MEPSEHDRRVMGLVHTALLAAVGVYGIVLLFFRAELEPDSRHPDSGLTLFLLFAAVGAAQFAGASIVGKLLLRSPRAGARDRVRLYFLLRAAAAEAIALYGFVLGFLGVPGTQVLALFAMAVAALLACFPGRGPWEEAVRVAEGREPGPENL
ncbi:MAG: hypothetical protein WD451_14915 [Thermoanaerobaculia bacterium]